MHSTFGHRSRTNKHLSTPKIKSSRVELESSKMSTNFPATKHRSTKAPTPKHKATNLADRDLAERKRIGGSQVMQGFKGEGQLGKSTQRPEKLSTVHGSRRNVVISMPENFGELPENATPAHKKQIRSRATTNAQIIETDQMNSKDKLSTGIGGIETLIQTLPDPGK